MAISVNTHAPAGFATSDDYAAKFKSDGYIVIRKAISEENVRRTVEEIYDFLEFDQDDLSAHYSDALRARSGIDQRGMVPFYHGQQLWNNRQTPFLFEIFSKLLGSTDLIVSIDRCNVNPPQTRDWRYSGFTHFDVDTTAIPIPFEVQGILGLSPHVPNGGGFKCYPGFHREIDQWAQRRPKDADPRFPYPDEFELFDVPLGPGDLVIFDGRLPHGNSANVSDVVRVAQYITMWRRSDEPCDPEERRECIEMKLPPLTRKGKRFPASPKREDTSQPVALSSLGQKLNGLTPR
ncbi:phytanoyl-CoA dioxygenase family protein [Agrobacterium rhizogenes]|nr:phytanoyl-CoA dioxygenase family protein [Rhizobium rhizogenes]